MKTIMAVLVLAVLVLAAVPAIGAETESGAEIKVKILGPVTWNRPDMFSGSDFRLIFTPDNFAVCREAVGDRCIPIVPDRGTSAEMLRSSGQRFPLVLPRIGDF